MTVAVMFPPGTGVSALTVYEAVAASLSSLPSPSPLMPMTSKSMASVILTV